MLQQRFALATFYYATTEALVEEVQSDNAAKEWEQCGATSKQCSKGGGNNWLSPYHECTWGYVVCQDHNIEDIVTELRFNFRGDALHGTLPPELSLLTKLEIIVLPNNHLYGGMLSNNKYWNDNHNNNDNDDDDKLSSPIHSIDWALQGISTLQVLNLYDNDFDGSIPTRIWETNPNLTLIFFNYNNFQGSIPTQIIQTTKLRELQLQGNLLTGTIPTEIANLASALRMY